MEVQSGLFRGKSLNASMNYSSLDSYKKQATEDTEEKFKNKDISNIKINSLDEMSIAKEIRRLEQWQAHVIAHEKMHMLAGGSLVGAPSYTYTYGPDGKKYIEGGEVTFYVPKGLVLEDGEKAIRKLKAAATAPLDPSPQDLKAAAMAGSLESSIRASILRKHLKKSYDSNRMVSSQQLKKSDVYVSPISMMTFQEVGSFDMFV